jgi:hypothetical protein
MRQAVCGPHEIAEEQEGVLGVNGENMAPQEAGCDVLGLQRRQDDLQAEAQAVLADLNLLALLRSLGEPTLIGSLALGVMVWRDIDLHVYCDEYSVDRCFAVMGSLASHPHVKQLRWDNERGAFNTGWLPNGYYWGVRYWTPERVQWKLDVWFLPRSAQVGEREEFLQLQSALTPDVRAAILQIKDAWHANPDYRSMAVYDAVVRHGARTIEDFQRYLV